MVVVLVVLLLVAILQGLVSAALILAARKSERVVAGFRKDFEHAIMSVHERITEREERTQAAFAAQAQPINQAFHTAAVANDRILYYTKHSAILERLGAKYDKAIAAIRAKAEVKQPEPDQDSAPEGTAQSEGIAGSIGMPCG